MVCEMFINTRLRSWSETRRECDATLISAGLLDWIHSSARKRQQPVEKQDEMEGVTQRGGGEKGGGEEGHRVY